MNDPTADPLTLKAAAEATIIALQLIKEGGRGAVLLGAARLDLGLEKLLKAVMTSHIGGDDNLFDPDRPLGTFSAKISLAYRLSLIDKPVEHALQMIRKVRNEFAHSFGDATLVRQEHQNRLSKPYSEAKRNPLWEDLEKALSTREDALSKELRDYVCLVVVLVAFMEACSDMQQKFSPKLTVMFTK